MKEIIISFILILTFSTFGNSQMEVSELNKRTHARQLRVGILLVQLPNSDKKIDILRNQGKEKRARQEEEEINKIRKEIIEGFQEKWDFSKILYFESSNSREAFRKNPDVLLDSNLKPIKIFPDVEHVYSVRYGPGNPNGEVYRYNGTGFQIRYVLDGELQTIKYDKFYHALEFGFFVNLFNKKSKIKRQIFKFNKKINDIKY